ncbi:MAG: hypothetical protein DHS20C18_11010 [Saprospiraceae bacterium]|nr:MAG: hypothetical protein DHS20C18_11010 [Saprospiraceae bacterium]
MPNANFAPKNQGSSNLKIVSAGKEPRGNGQPKLGEIFLLLVFGILVGGYYLIGGDKNPPFITNEDGEKALSPERQAKLDRELEEIDNAKQYALIAGEEGYYPCYICPESKKTIFLNIGEVWKYGVTRKGEKGRYPGENYGAPDLIFVTQFEGHYAACLKKEKIMIYNYPLLPEAQRRKIILLRPPGNKYDN